MNCTTISKILFIDKSFQGTFGMIIAINDRYRKYSNKIDKGNFHAFIVKM